VEESKKTTGIRSMKGECRNTSVERPYTEGKRLISVLSYIEQEEEEEFKN
jgi:hypothetical protein